MITDVNKRLIKDCDILDSLCKMLKLLDNIDEGIAFYLNEIKLLNNLIETYSNEECLHKLKILQENLLKLMQITLKKNLNDGIYIFDFNITENSSFDGFIQNYFSYNFNENKLFNKIHFNLNFNNWYVFNVPVFNFNLDKSTNALAINIKINGENYYYLLTPSFKEINIDSVNDTELNIKKFVNLKNYFNEIINQNINEFEKILWKIRNELEMIGNVMEIINI